MTKSFKLYRRSVTEMLKTSCSLFIGGLNRINDYSTYLCTVDGVAVPQLPFAIAAEFRGVGLVPNTQF